MGEKTDIQWTDATWSPWEGCTKISPGCNSCYAEGMNRWLRKGENWGPGAPRRIYSSAHWDKPLRWNDKAKAEGRRLRVFPSVCDPFDNEVAPIIRARFFELIERTPHIDWLLLTKRIGNAAQMMFLARGGHLPLLPNVWIGATVVNQEEADRDIPKLLATPARVRFLSCEPLLGPIELRHALGFLGVGGVDWVIAGGESGPKARPMHPQWARDIRDQCAAAGVSFLMKQWGEWCPAESVANDDERKLAERWIRLDGTEPAPGAGVDFFGGDEVLYRVGKKAAGRLLDGVQHDGFPEVR